MIRRPLPLIGLLAAVSAVVASPATGTNPAKTGPAPEPIEYVLQADGRAVPRGELAEPFAETVEVRPDGDRTNRWITGVTTPSITLHLPAGEPTTAAVVCPGGGYLGHSFDNEGQRLAAWLADRGVAAGVLKYRTHTGEPLGDKPLRDAQAAVRFLRQKTELAVGVIGFSAGGHLAAMTANTPPGRSDADGDEADPPRLAFHALMYPVTSMADGVTHKFSRRLTLGESPSEEAKARFSPHRLVTAKTPPVFLVHTADDRDVLCDNSLLYFEACRNAGVEAELHLYPAGGHGWGMRAQTGTLEGWKRAFEAWLVSHGWARAHP